MAFDGRLYCSFSDSVQILFYMLYLPTRMVYYGANGHVILFFFWGGGICPAHEMCGQHNFFNKNTCVS